mgnify:CR=1 FL=1
MQRLNENYASINQMASKLLRNHSTKTEDSQSAEISFEQVLKTTKENSNEGLKFSKHANERLATRNINLSAEQITRIENGTTKAREKGIQESLVMVDNMAFIVNVKNNTVVTAIGDSADSIFTNIDGAVIG